MSEVTTVATERAVPPDRKLRHLVGPSIVPLSAWIYAVDHRPQFRYSVLMGQTGAAARAHYSNYLHTWILIQSLLLGVSIGAISLLLGDSQKLLEQLATLMFGFSALMFLNSIGFMSIVTLNFSACSPANFTAFGYVADSSVRFAEFLLTSGIYPCILATPLVTISVMADPATTPVSIQWLHDSKLLTTVFIGMEALVLAQVLYHINTISTVIVRGRMVESEAVVPESVIGQGKSAVIDHVVASILAVSDETGKVATTAEVLERTWRAGARERQTQSRPSLVDLCALFQRELGVGGKTLMETVQLASVELGCSSDEREDAVMDTAVRCWQSLGRPRPEDVAANDNGEFASPLVALAK
jgi:hypothetical protein